MKTVVVAGMLLVVSSIQSFGMGHPHNVFAARKQLRAKPPIAVVIPKNEMSECWQHMIQATKTLFSDLTVVTLSRISSVSGL